MIATILLLGLGVFSGCFLLFYLLLNRTSPESTLLKRIAHQSSGRVAPAEGSTSRSMVNVERLAKPFTVLRSFFAGQPDPDLVRRLSLAGFRKAEYADIFLGVRLLLPALLGFSVALLVSESTILFFFLAIVVGFFLPDFWLGWAVKRHRERIRLSLPDGLDLLSICIEAGLGLDQGIVRVGQELRVSHPALSEEFLHINFEQRAGVQRSAAWKSFADRTNLESVRSFVGMLNQTDRFGTPISKALGVYSDSLRTQRRQQAEERAAKTTIKLIPPLVFFIFPNVFVVLVAPAVITVIQSIGHISGP